MADIKIFTEVNPEELSRRIKSDDKIFSIGSCFADGMGELLAAHGFDCTTNPFGTQYNVCSIYNSLNRLCRVSEILKEEGEEGLAGRIESGLYPFFGESDVVKRPDGKFVSFSHHSRCGSMQRENFLQKANTELVKNARKLDEAQILIITLGTSFVYFQSGADVSQANPTAMCRGVVSNCHKFPASDFTREYVHTDTCTAILRDIATSFPDKTIILTVSPIRHLGDGAHLNLISKSTLLLAVQRVVYGTSYTGQGHSTGLYYFPSYEIMMDELRDYRWYGDDLVHPSPMAVRFIFERFKEYCIDSSCYDSMHKAYKEYKRSQHQSRL